MQTENKEDIECEVRMLIHQTQAGRIIGRGGCKVKELRQVMNDVLKMLCSSQIFSSVAALLCFYLYLRIIEIYVTNITLLCAW